MEQKLFAVAIFAERQIAPGYTVCSLSAFSVWGQREQAVTAWATEANLIAHPKDHGWFNHGATSNSTAIERNTELVQPDEDVVKWLAHLIRVREQNTHRIPV